MKLLVQVPWLNTVGFTRKSDKHTYMFNKHPILCKTVLKEPYGTTESQSIIAYSRSAIFYTRVFCIAFHAGSVY